MTGASDTPIAVHRLFTCVTGIRTLIFGHHSSTGFLHGAVNFVWSETQRAHSDVPEARTCGTRSRSVHG